MIALIAVSFAGMVVEFGQPPPAERIVEMMAADSNPSVTLKCLMHDRDQKQFSFEIRQTGGLAFPVGGYEAGKTKYEYRKTPTITQVVSDDTGLFEAANMRSIFDAKLDSSIIKGGTTDGWHQYMIQFFGEGPSWHKANPTLVTVVAKPPPVISVVREGEKPEPRVTPPKRAGTMVGFCDLIEAKQIPLTLEELNKLGTQKT